MIPLNFSQTFAACRSLSGKHLIGGENERGFQHGISARGSGSPFTSDSFLMLMILFLLLRNRFFKNSLLFFPSWNA